jgi:hypothetical protein
MPGGSSSSLHQVLCGWFRLRFVSYVELMGCLALHVGCRDGFGGLDGFMEL